MKSKKLIKAEALLIASSVRDSELENLHSGVFPSSKTGDFSDVKVVSPYGEIPWKDLSRISDKEMRNLMLDIQKNILSSLNFLAKQQEIEGEKWVCDLVEKFNSNGPSWDRKDYIEPKNSFNEAENS
jgi:hypothetical protein